MPTGLEVTVRLGKRAASMDSLIVELVPALVGALACPHWYYDRDATLPEHRLILNLAVNSTTVPRDEIEAVCFASLRGLASGADILDSRLIATPHPERPDDAAVPQVRVMECKWAVAQATLHQWLSESAVGVLKSARAGEIDRKTLMPPVIATLVDGAREGCNPDNRQWLSTLVDKQLAEVTLATANAIKPLRVVFDEKLAALKAAGQLQLRGDVRSLPSYAGHLARLERGWSRMGPCKPLSDDVLADLLLRHIVRLGFTRLEACYLFLLSMAEFP